MIGGDIGCGITSIPAPPSIIAHKNSLKKLDRVIKSNIPMGNGWDRVHQSPVITIEQYQPFFELAQTEAIAFASSYHSRFGSDIQSFMPTYSEDWLRNDLCMRCKSDFDYDMRCLGTLGGGNHFIEINEAADTQIPYVTVHSGSRNIGHKIAAYHHSVMLGIRQEEVEMMRNRDLNDDDDTIGK